MKPIPFPESNTVYSKDQLIHEGYPEGPKFIPLPAYTNSDETITCWQLTWTERLRVLWTGRLWWRQLNWGKPLQAQNPSVTKPFIRIPLEGL